MAHTSEYANPVVAQHTAANLVPVIAPVDAVAISTSASPSLMPSGMPASTKPALGMSTSIPGTPQPLTHSAQPIFDRITDSPQNGVRLQSQGHLATNTPLSPMVLSETYALQPNNDRITPAVSVPETTMVENVPTIATPATVVDGSSLVSVLATTQESANAPIVIAGITFSAIPQSVPLVTPSPIAVGGQTVKFTEGAVQIGSQTIVHDAAPVTVSGIRVSLGPNGVVIGSSTIAVPQPSVFTIGDSGGQVLTVDSSGFAIAGTSLTPGGPPLTISGTPISLGPSALIIGTSTIALQPPTPTVFSVGNQIFTPNVNGFAIASTSLYNGGPGMTISGTPISFGSAGLIIGTSTYRVPEIFTVAGQPFTAAPTGFIIASRTLSPGGPGVTISGTPISLGPSANLVIGSSTIPLETAASQGLGALIMSGFGTMRPSTTPPTSPTSISTNSTIQFFEGSQTKTDVPKAGLIFSLVACLILIAYILV
ncbi:hypothetical protein MMC24_000007 [Lignoscripta atroalba]|nr:hypothetical protein [Lignoscripta atroalba]